jgi:hypothetical protein
MPLSCGGTYTLRTPVRDSVLVTTDMWWPVPISEKRTALGPIQLRPDALATREAAGPPATGTCHVSHAQLSSMRVYAIRDASGEKAGDIFTRSSKVS